MARFLLGGTALVGAVQAVVFRPEATGLAALLAEVNFPQPTFAPSFQGMKDLKRQATTTSPDTFLIAPDNTCGFVSGRPGAAYTCNSATDTCVFITSASTINGHVGCCNKNDCGFRLACLDLIAVSTSSLCDDGCKVDTFTAKCTETSAQYCNTVTFAGGTTDYFCNSLSISTAQEVKFTYDGQTGRTLSPLTVDDSTTTTGPPKTTPSGSNTPTPTNPGNNNNNNNNNTNNNGGGGGGGGGSNAGAIAGGVVGGVAVIGLAALGIIFLMRRRKQSPAAPPVQPAPQMGQQQPGFGPPGPGLPPAGSHQSYYGGSDPTKLAAAAGAYPHTQPTPPLQNPSPHQAYGAPPPAGYFPPAHNAQLLPGQVPDRADATSPLSNYNRMSQLPTSPSTATEQGFSSVSPGQQFGTPVTQQTGSPPPATGAAPLHEAGGTAVGQPGYNDGHHRGQMHELA